MDHVHCRMRLTAWACNLISVSFRNLMNVDGSMLESSPENLNAKLSAFRKFGFEWGLNPLSVACRPPKRYVVASHAQRPGLNVADDDSTGIFVP